MTSAPYSAAMVATAGQSSPTISADDRHSQPARIFGDPAQTLEVARIVRVHSEQHRLRAQFERALYAHQLRRAFRSVQAQNHRQSLPDPRSPVPAPRVTRRHGIHARACHAADERNRIVGSMIERHDQRAAIGENPAQPQRLAQSHVSIIVCHALPQAG